MTTPNLSTRLTQVDPARLGARRGDLWHIGLRADFAEAVVYSMSGGINELEIGGLCTSPETAESLKVKIDAQLQKRGVDVSLWLTADEAMCLACASQNCRFDSLPLPQIQRLDAWLERWKLENAEAITA